MAYKIVDADALDSALDALAESIKTKSGVTGDLSFPNPNGFKSAVDMIQTIINGTNPTTITSNGNHATGGYSHVQVDVPPTIPDGYVSFTQYYTYEHTQQTANTLEIAHTFTCGFQPKVALISLNTDTTLSTVDGVVFTFRCNIEGLTNVGKGFYKLSTGNRLGTFGGGISFTSTGIAYSHGSKGFVKGVKYNVYAWG